MLDKLLTVSKPDLLDKNVRSDREFRSLLNNYFAFSHCLERSRAKFANYIGLSSAQYMILIAIAHAPEPLGINQIADQLHLSGAFVTIEVNKLVADGLVDKSVHPTDARRVQLIVTQEGLSRLTQLAGFQRPVNDALFGMLSREEFKQLSGLLARLAGNGEKAVALAGHIEAMMGTSDHQGWSAETSHKQVRKQTVRRP